MYHAKCFTRFILVIVLVLIFTSDTSAQNGGYYNNRYGGRNFNSGLRYNNYKNYISIGIGYSGYRGYGSSYGYGSPYAYYPNYRYQPFYRQPSAFIHFGPAFGLRVNVLPFGYDPFYIGRDPYYYYEGIYYKPNSNEGYEVTAPPLGATVKHLPAGTKPTVINGQEYYELGGTFYSKETNAKNKLQYVVVGTNGVLNTGAENLVEPENTSTSAVPNAAPDTTPQPANLNQLPPGSKAVIISGQKYYLANSGVYYQEITDANNTVSYKAAGGSEIPK